MLVIEMLEETSRSQGIKTKLFLTGWSASRYLLYYLAIILLMQLDSFSTLFLSSNILAMLLSDISSIVKYYQKNSDLEIIGAMLVAANYDYEASMSKLESSMIGSIYSRLFVFQFKLFLNANQHMHSYIPNDDLQRLYDAQFISEYDRSVHKMNGYESLDVMYERLSPKLILKNIQVPTITMVLCIKYLF